MAIYNVHERLLPAKPADAGTLIDTLASDADALWPSDAWPAMRLDRPLGAGALGGHGPIRYTVAAYVPSTWVRFAFTGPRGFDGFHEFAALPVGEERTLLRHTLAMNPRGPARLTWPLVWRPLHNACVEDSLDRAERTYSGEVARRAGNWGLYVHLLRRLARTR